MKMKLTYRNLIKYFIVFSFVLLVFQSPLSRSGLPAIITTPINNFDELLALVFGVILIFRCLTKSIPKSIAKMIGLMLIFVVIGFIGTVFNNLQPMRAVIEDLVNCTKFLLTYLGFMIIANRYDSADILRSLQKIAKFLIIAIFALTIIDLFFPNVLFSDTTYRYGLHSVHLFYYHPSVLAQVMVLLIGIISFNTVGIKHINILKAMCLIVLATTLRGKAIGFVCFYLFLMGYEKLRIGKARILLVLLAVLTILFVSSDNITKYYGNESSARVLLTVDSIEIAKENFPIGLGFGTFASASAAKYYSPVYSSLGYSSRYGMGYNNTSYLTDTFWPVLFGEFGFLGVFVYGIIIILLIRRSLNVARNNKDAGIAVLSLMGYLLICSTSGTAFFNPIAVPNALMIVLGLKQFGERH